MRWSTRARVRVSAHAQRFSASLRAPFRGAGREVQAGDLAADRARATNDAVLFFDGTKWTPEPIPAPFFPLPVVACGGAVFAAGWDGTNTVLASRRSGQWTKLTIPVITLDVRDLSCSGPDARYERDLVRRRGAVRRQLGLAARSRVDIQRRRA